MWSHMYYSQLEAFSGSQLKHSLARDRKDCHGTRIRQPNTDAHASTYGTTHAPHVRDAVILIKEQEQVPLLMCWDRRGFAQF